MPWSIRRNIRNADIAFVGFFFRALTRPFQRAAVVIALVNRFQKMTAITLFNSGTGSSLTVLAYRKAHGVKQR